MGTSFVFDIQEDQHGNIWIATVKGLFQFNPEELTRSRGLTFNAPSVKGRRKRSLREFHQQQKDLHKVRRKQDVTLEEESISFDVRLDATDQIGLGDEVAAKYGVAPDLAALEMMCLPQRRKKKRRAKKKKTAKKKAKKKTTKKKTRRKTRR